MVEMLYFVFCVSQDCMSSLFVMVASLWVVFWEHNTDFFDVFSVIEGTDIVANLIAENIWGSEYEITVALIDSVKSWD